ncbi:MAG: EAL domain-containing protein, partial [Bacillota bacterium]|nr:EAL domain-containing protein [Bacillota bacterium]
KYADRTKQWPISSALFDEIRRDFMSMVRKVDFEEEGADQQIYEYFGSKEIYFLRYISKRVDNRIYHFVMNYSQEVRNKMRILYERDHDGITSLLNRFAFRERVNQTLVERPARRAAMVMWDLDDLKYVNDTYGHDYGDKYLKYAGTVLSTIQTPETFVSRVSGDEFFAFIPFDEGKERVIEMVQSLRSRMLESRLVIGEYSDIPIRATAGIAWYPEDGSTFEELKRHADFAMYTAKRSEKGSIAEFDMTLYEGDAILITGREQFNAFLEREEADFAFQPIVDLKQGKVFAFEALMRPTSKHITNVFDVMRIAKMQSKLKAIEWMTWNGVLTKAKQNLDVIGDRRIFINSIASVAFDESEIEELESRFGSLLSHLVVEITESERLEYRSIDVQRKLKGRWKTKMAIDDFGTAYSSESMLLEVMPDFVKLDMTLIRNIHEDVSRQKLVANILDYVETRGIKLIAEGVEQLEELRFLKKIGVPYVQGFYLGKPSLYIVDPDPRLLDEIRSM